MKVSEGGLPAYCKHAKEDANFGIAYSFCIVGQSKLKDSNKGKIWIRMPGLSNKNMKMRHFPFVKQADGAFGYYLVVPMFPQGGFKVLGQLLISSPFWTDGSRGIRLCAFFVNFRPPMLIQGPTFSFYL